MPKAANKNLYFDYAAATPLDKDVLKKMEPYFSDFFYNPSSNYRLAKKIKDDLDVARSKIGHWLGAKPTEIIFTSGGTEANNLAIRGVLESFPDSEVLVSAIEHESVLKPAELYNHKQICVRADGSLNIENLKKNISDKTVLVSVMYANNEIGTIQPLREIAEVLTKVRRARQMAGNKLPLYFHSDAAQAGNYLDLHVARLGLDLMTVNGGKLYGPKQSGILWVRSGVVLSPQILGAEQEHGRRSGTENVANDIGFAEALDKAQKIRKQESERLNKLQKLFIDELTREIKGVSINGSLKRRLPDNVHFTIPGQDNERLLFKLEQAGVYAAAGSACGAGSDEPSHVLRAIGLSDDLAKSSFRFTMGRPTTQSEVKQVSKKIVDLLE